jgi:holliday junction DNA helicase RuvA
VIAIIKGVLVEKKPLVLIIETHGIGYEVNVPLTTTEKLPAQGEIVMLYTLAVYREDSATLYGFKNKEDRAFFRLLVEKVSGIGPKIALSILSKFPVSTLKHAISCSDTSLLSNCPGIGKKTAERIVIELQDKILPKSPSQNTPGKIYPENQDTRIKDAISALVSLGYKQTEAHNTIQRTLDKFPSDDYSVETLIKAALV